MKYHARFTALALAILTITLSFLLSACSANEEDKGYPDDFRFTIKWSVHASSYTSSNGQLIRIGDASDPDYGDTATLTLSDEQMKEIYELIDALDVESYPNKIGSESRPPIPLILTVQYGEVHKKIECYFASGLKDSENAQEQQYYSACQRIIEIITSTDEWNSLPESNRKYE